MWSISPLLIIGAGETPPFLMTAMALIIASIVLFFEGLIKKQDFKKIIRQPLTAYVLTIYGIGGYVIFWFLGFKNAPAFEANTLNYLWPILLVFFSYLVSKEKLSGNKIIGLFLGFFGTILLFSQGKNIDVNHSFFWGYIFALVGAIIWATYSTATRYVSFPNRAMMAFMLVPGLISLVIHFSVEQIYIPSLKEFLFVVLLGLTRISFLFWDYAMKHGEITFISSLSYFIPIISTILLILFGHAPRNEIILVSTLLVLAGCLIVNIEAITKTLGMHKKV